MKNHILLSWFPLCSSMPMFWHSCQSKFIQKTYSCNPSQDGLPHGICSILSISGFCRLLGNLLPYDRSCDRWNTPSTLLPLGNLVKCDHILDNCSIDHCDCFGILCRLFLRSPQDIGWRCGRSHCSCSISCLSLLGLK